MTILRTNTIAGIGSDGAGTVLGGSFSFTSQNYVILPKGTTGDRVGVGSTPGALRYNTDSSKVELYDGSQWTEVQSSRPDLNGGARGVFGGGTPAFNVIDYATISSTGNAIDFGDLTQSRAEGAALSSQTRGVWTGHSVPGAGGNTMDFVTISSTGNAVSFGNLTTTIRQSMGGGANSTRGIWAGGYAVPGGRVNTIEYITIATTGNAQDFGDLTTATSAPISAASSTRCVFAGGSTPADNNTIEFITISTLGNSADFGDLTRTDHSMASVTNATRAVFASGGAKTNTLDFITIATLGNAQDFGDLNRTNTYAMSSASSSTRGVFSGGGYPSSTNEMSYITILTVGNAIDFGDLTLSRSLMMRGICSNAHGGL